MHVILRALIKMKKLLFTCYLLFFVIGFVFADTISINHFVIKENPFAKNEIAVVATDTAGNIQENVNGIFTFSINCFSEEMTFDKGTAFYRHKLDKSSFIYARHNNDQ